MNSTGFENLKGLNLPIVVPGAIPPGFSLKRAETSCEEGFDGYTVEWTSPSGGLYLYGVSGGIGDRMMGDETLEFHHPTFGAGRIDIDGSKLGTSWISEMSDGLPAYCLLGEGLSQEQFLQTVLSLNYLKL